MSAVLQLQLNIMPIMDKICLCVFPPLFCPENQNASTFRLECRSVLAETPKRFPENSFQASGKTFHGVPDIKSGHTSKEMHPLAFCCIQFFHISKQPPYGFLFQESLKLIGGYVFGDDYAVMVQQIICKSFLQAIRFINL